MMASRLANTFFAALLLALQSSACATQAPAAEGHYLGALRVPEGPPLQIGVELFERADGSAWASFASPDQDAYDVPVARFTRRGDKLDLDLGFASLSLAFEDQRLKGQYSQNSAPVAVELRPVESFPQRDRPQDPKGPFPYTSSTLAIESADGVVLGATLSMPVGRRRPNLVVLVHGSGPSNRDGNVAGHRGLKVLADHLARAGLAVLRYDKRGIARSTGNYDQHTFAQLVDDLSAVMQAMRKRGQFGRIGVVGVSEGPGVAAALAARKAESVDFLVSLSGVGLSGMEMILLQDRVYLERQHPSAEELERLMAYVGKWYQTVQAHDDAQQRVEALKSLMANLTREERSLVAKYKADHGTLSLDWASKPFVRAMLLADARADWRAVRCPVLALGGELDVQVPAKENIDAIVASLQAGGNRRVEAHVLPALNHLLQTASSGAEDEYATIEETIAPAVIERVARFAASQR